MPVRRRSPWYGVAVLIGVGRPLRTSVVRCLRVIRPPLRLIFPISEVPYTDLNVPAGAIGALLPAGGKEMCWPRCGARGHASLREDCGDHRLPCPSPITAPRRRGSGRVQPAAPQARYRRSDARLHPCPARSRAVQHRGSRSYRSVRAKRRLPRVWEAGIREVNDPGEVAGGAAVDRAAEAGLPRITVVTVAVARRAGYRADPHLGAGRSGWRCAGDPSRRMPRWLPIADPSASSVSLSRGRSPVVTPRRAGRSPAPTGHPSPAAWCCRRPPSARRPLPRLVSALR